MAYLNADRALHTGLIDRFSAFRKTLVERRTRYALYKRTIEELGALTDRDLADLGVSRSDVRRIAYEAAYGG
jgi:uncharacterized protein YjiS (DUF1127 family)